MSRYTWGDPTQDQSNVAGSRLADQIRARVGSGLDGYSFETAKDAALAELLATTPETFNVKSFGAVGDGVADDTVAIQSALDAAKAVGGICVAPAGTYLVSSKLVIGCNADFSQATIEETGTPAYAVEVSTGSADNPSDRVFRLRVILGRVVSSKSGAGWTGLGSGVRIVNCVGCEIHLGHIENFSTGVHVEANTAANAYNRFFLGDIHNNLIGLHLDPGVANGGYVNENMFFGGRFRINSNEGAAISGARYVYIEDSNNNRPNNIQFFGVTFESGEPEYNLLCEGQENMFIGCRWESVSEVRFSGVGATDNVILGGYDAYKLVNGTYPFTQEDSANRNSVWALRTGIWLGSSANAAFSFRNQSSGANPAVASYPADVDPYTDPGKWVVGLLGDGLQVKGDTNAEPFLYVRESDGRVYIGDGTNEVDAYFVRTAAAVALVGAPLRLPNFTDSTRGTASVAGRVIFNTDSGSLNVDDGTAWRALPRHTANGTATLANGTTSIVVTHGLGVTPDIQDISVTPIEAWGSATQFWISTPTSTQFTITVDTDPGQDVDFAWTASVQ